MACIYTEHETLPVVEIRVVGRVTENDMDKILPQLEAFIARHGTVRLIEVIERFDGFDPTTILDGIKFDIKHLKDISHAAIVSDIPWVGFMTSSVAMVMPLTIRVFPEEKLDEAMAWIAKPD